MSLYHRRLAASHFLAGAENKGFSSSESQPTKIREETKSATFHTGYKNRFHNMQKRPFRHIILTLDVYD
jgi:hypothetical protein